MVHKLWKLYFLVGALMQYDYIQVNGLAEVFFIEILKLLSKNYALMN